MIASRMPPQLLVGEIKKEDELAESSHYDKNSVIYHKTYPKNDFKEYIKKRVNKNEAVLRDNLPTRLYNIKEEHLENFKEQKVEEIKTEPYYQTKKDKEGNDIKPN